MTDYPQRPDAADAEPATPSISDLAEPRLDQSDASRVRGGVNKIEALTIKQKVSETGVDG